MHRSAASPGFPGSTAALRRRTLLTGSAAAALSLSSTGRASAFAAAPRRIVMRRMLIGLMAAVLSLVSLVVIAPAYSDHGSKQGVFAVRECLRTNTAPDDPIVYPGQPGAAHLHEFFGNTSTDAYSTTKSLLAANTTCEIKGDTAAYWVPALYENGKYIPALKASAYYLTGVLHNPHAIEPFPLGLRMIAGDAHATGRQDLNLVNWNCHGRSTGGTALPPASCPADSKLRLRIEFPNCWDGKNLDSSNHKSHMAYSRFHGGYCPSSHPVEMPTMRVGFLWNIDGTYGNITLSSHTALTGHADFWNAWDMAELTRLVEKCLHGRLSCK